MRAAPGTMVSLPELCLQLIAQELTTPVTGWRATSDAVRDAIVLCATCRDLRARLMPLMVGQLNPAHCHTVTLSETMGPALEPGGAQQGLRRKGCTVRELKAACKQIGLPVCGKSDELRARLWAELQADPRLPHCGMRRHFCSQACADYTHRKACKDRCDRVRAGLALRGCDLDDLSEESSLMCCSYIRGCPSRLTLDQMLDDVHEREFLKTHTDYDQRLDTLCEMDEHLMREFGSTAYWRHSHCPHVEDESRRKQATQDALSAWMRNQPTLQQSWGKRMTGDQLCAHSEAHALPTIPRTLRIAATNILYSLR